MCRVAVRFALRVLQLALRPVSVRGASFPAVAKVRVAVVGVRADVACGVELWLRGDAVVAVVAGRDESFLRGCFGSPSEGRREFSAESSEFPQEPGC